MGKLYESFLNIVLDKSLLKMSPNNHDRRKYMRIIVSDALLIELLEEGSTASEISRKLFAHLGFKIGEDYIIRRLKECGASPPSHSESAHLSMNKRKQTNMDRFGATNPLARGTKCFHKRNETIFVKYGSDSSVFSNPEVKDKIKQSNMEKYGMAHPYHARNTIGCLTKPHKVVSDWLSSRGIDHVNEQRNLFSKFNANLNRVYNPVPDITIHSKKTVIEIYGDYWHACPKIFKPNDIIHANWHQYKKSTGNFPTAQDIWDFDAVRKNHIESQGYSVVVLWDNEIQSGEFKERLKNV